MGGPHAGRAGTCVYCGGIAVDNCQFCGALVCMRHLDAASGSCTGCLAGKKVEE
ncbi:MAG: hypothetical protein NTY99_00740 [DPANN group archaeon]|nr:hypothetical protein [DPANN group archaeon]